MTETILCVYYILVHQYYSIVYFYLDILMNQLKRWAYRRHSNMSRKWIRDKYFIKNGERSWIFGYKYEDNGKKTIFALMKLSDIPIKRHIKVKCESNSFEPTWDAYFERRRQKCYRQRA